MRIMVALVGLALLCFCCLAARPAAAADADVRYVITNGGVDVGPEHGSIFIFPEGKRDGSIAAPDSGATAHIPAGTYNVHVEFEDGSAKKDIWFDNQTFSGKVDKTVEIAVPLTDVRYLITNGGTDVGDKGEVRYFPPGKREGSVNWALSGKPARLAAGSYDVVVRFVDGDARKEIWFVNQQFSGRVEKTVEIALPTTDVRYVITNGGVDVKGKALARYFPDGDHDHSITWAQSGGTVRLPAGVYSVHIEFSDGDAHKNLWIDNQNFTGTVEKTVELALPVTDVRYLITNNGADTGGNGQARYFPNGNHTDSDTWSNSGGTVRMPVGTYSVHVTFNDGDAHRDMWFDNETFSGHVEKTVEIGLQITDVRYVITNNGADAGGNGQARYFPNGNHTDSVTWANSGGTVRMPEGTYSVHVTFSDGEAHRDMWFDNETFSGHVEKTVEIGLQTTDVRYVVTNNGADTGGNGQAHYFPNGNHTDDITWSNSGGTVRLPAGTYSVHVIFNDGGAHRDKWIDNEIFSGKVDKTVEIGLAVAEARYVVTNGGADVGQLARVHYFPAGKHDNEIRWAASGGSVRLPEGDYDAQVAFTDGLARKEIWLENQHLSGTVEGTIELGMTLAEPTVMVTQNGAAIDQAEVGYFDPATKHEFGTVPKATRTVVEAGTYDIHADYNGADGWLRDVAIDGAPRLTIDLTPPVSAPVPPPPPPPPPTSLTIAAPGAMPEPIVPERGDFPYLPPVPGSTISSGKADPSPVYVQLADSKQPELVANSSIEKCYSLPNGTGGAAVLTAYHDALPAVGWTIVSETHQANAGLTSHYGQNGRNIWGDIRLSPGGYCIAVADATVEETKLAADLNTQCHLALTGVLFDFNKSTLKPESDAVLQQVSLILRDDPPLKLEVQGNTDNVGSDAYNQPLSEARARSVVVWLGQHGVASGRLTSRGYGKTRPAASNATDEGRARNRRVEIANPACKAAAK
jgi:OmpA-OmpF porin, OOP family